MFWKKFESSKKSYQNCIETLVWILYLEGNVSIQNRWLMGTGDL